MCVIVVRTQGAGYIVAVHFAAAFIFSSGHFATKISSLKFRRQFISSPTVRRVTLNYNFDLNVTVILKIEQ